MRQQKKSRRTTAKKIPAKKSKKVSRRQPRSSTQLRAAETNADEIIAVNRAAAAARDVRWTTAKSTTKKAATSRAARPLLRSIYFEGNRKSNVRGGRTTGRAVRRPSLDRHAFDLPPKLRNFRPKNIVIMYRPFTSEAVKLARELTTWLTEQNFQVYASPGQNLGPQAKRFVAKDLPKIDWVIVLGGDGTYLRAVQMLGDQQIPILGVNMGSLGFLTEIRVEDLYKMILFTLHRRMEFRPRSMLKITVRRKNKVIATHLALNDAVLERGSSTHLINIAVFSERHLVAEVKADALIIASPTGSTAYNLAAGGPILHPDVRALVLTPVCPHALTTRPLIFPDDQELGFKVLTEDKRAVLTVDGMNRGDILIDDEVTIIRSPIDHMVIRRPSHNYFQLLREKLQFGERD